jgi:hypothetical protein
MGLGIHRFLKRPPSLTLRVGGKSDMTGEPLGFFLTWWVTYQGKLICLDGNMAQNTKEKLGFG